MHDIDETQEFGAGFYKYFERSLQTKHLELSFPTVQEAFDITPNINKKKLLTI